MDISTTLENKFRVSECGLGKAVEWVDAICNNVSSEHIYLSDL